MIMILIIINQYNVNSTGQNISESRKENPKKLTQLSSRSHPRHLVGKRTAQKDTIIDITGLQRGDKIMFGSVASNGVFNTTR